MEWKKKAILALILLGGMTVASFVGAWMLPGFFSQVTIGQFVLLLISIALAMALGAFGFARFSALNADNKHRGPGGMKGEVGWLLLAAIIVGGLLVGGAFLLAGGMKSQSVSPSQVPAPAPGTAGSTDTYQVRGLAAAGTVQAAAYAPFALAQTYAVDAVDFDQGSAVTTLTVVNLTDAVSGVPYQKTVLPGGSVLTALVSKSGYINDVVTMRSGASDTSPTAHARLKAYDSSMSMTAYNQGARTANVVGTKQALTASSGTTFKLEITPSARNKRIAGGDNNEFAVLINATNATTNFVASNFAVKTNGGFANTVSGTPLALTQPPSAMGGNYVVGFSVPADFSGTDTGIYGLDVTVYASSGWTGGSNASISICIVPMDYYQQVNAQLGAAKGSLHTGPAKDDGSAIQTIVCEDVFVN